MAATAVPISTSRHDECDDDTKPSRCLFTQCQNQLHTINEVVEYLLVIKEEIRRYSKLEHAIAHKKNAQAERIASRVNTRCKHVQTGPLWVGHLLQSLASQLIQHAKENCSTTETLRKHCADIQTFLDNHQRVMKRVNDSSKSQTSSPDRNPVDFTTVRLRSPRKITTERKAGASALISPPPPSRPKQGIALGVKGPQKADGIAHKMFNDFYQAAMEFERIKIMRLALFNRVEYLDLQKKSIESQLDEANRLMETVSKESSGKTMQWTAQSKLKDTISRCDFLKTCKSESEEEAGKARCDLGKFDNLHGNVMEHIDGVFTSTRTEYEGLLQESIVALKSAIGWDKPSSTFTNMQIFDCMGSEKSWKSFDEGSPLKGNSKELSDGRVCVQICQHPTSMEDGDIKNTTNLASDTDGITKEVLTDAYRCSASSKNPFISNHFSNNNLPMETSSKESSNEDTLLSCESSMCDVDIPACFSGCGNLPFTVDDVIFGLKNTNGLSSGTDEDKTNNKCLIQPEQTLKQVKNIEGSDNSGVTLVYTKYGKRSAYETKCSNVSSRDLNTVENLVKGFEKKEKEENKINCFIKKYLLSLETPDSSRSFRQEGGLPQSTQSCPAMVTPDGKNTLDDKSTPITITVSKKSKQKFRVSTCPNVKTYQDFDIRRKSYLSLSNCELKNCLKESDNSPSGITKPVQHTRKNLAHQSLEQKAMSALPPSIYTNDSHGCAKKGEGRRKSGEGVFLKRDKDYTTCVMNSKIQSETNDDQSNILQPADIATSCCASKENELPLMRSVSSENANQQNVDSFGPHISLISNNFKKDRSLHSSNSCPVNLNSINVCQNSHQKLANLQNQLGNCEPYQSYHSSLKITTSASTEANNPKADSGFVKSCDSDLESPTLTSSLTCTSTVDGSQTQFSVEEDTPPKRSAGTRRVIGKCVRFNDEVEYSNSSLSGDEEDETVPTDEDDNEFDIVNANCCNSNLKLKSAEEACCKLPILKIKKDYK